MSITSILLVAAALAPWQDPQVNSMNRLPARAMSFPAETEQMAIDIAQWRKPKDASRWVISLDREWDFKWKRTPDREWEKEGKIKVPSCWQLQGEYDPPLYTNVKYPLAFDGSGDPMKEPPKEFTSFEHRNPVGLYRTTFRRPWRWWFRRTVIRFEGVSSAFYLRVNGQTVGYAEDSRLPSEFDLSPYLRWFGENELEVEVYKHSDGTYLEDQDFWRFSGIFRSVYLVSENRCAPKDMVVETWLADDLKTGKFTVRDENGKELKVRDVPKPMLWSSEFPNVYMTPMEHKWGWWIFGGTDYYVVSFGFRKLEMKDGVLYLNGKRALFMGVDRHEMQPESGYTVTREGMQRDVQLMRDFNVNAVRTCHYPDVPDWYDLCDRSGIMLVCEANVESHGAGFKEKSLAKDPKWKSAHVERGTRMIGFYRNHPSIIFWSMGNEAGDGENFIDEYKAMKAMDATRPIQYQGAQATDHSDIMCPMYMRPWDCEKYLKSGPKKPLILCEYTHAMGNSNGGAQKYWDLVWKYPHAQGGFVWDFADQAVWKTDARGKWLAYGGDFGDNPNDDNFNCNGLVDALRNPHPGLNELKHAYQSVFAESLDWETGAVNVRNGFRFTDLEDLDGIEWTAVDADGNETAKGTVSDFKLAPEETGVIKLEGLKGDSVTVRFMRDGDIIAWNTFTKPFKPPAVPPAASSAGAALPLRLNFWRAPTDNDRGWRMPSVCKVWKDATDSQKPPAGVKSDLKVSSLADGTKLVDWTLTVPKGLPPIPRVGLTLTIPAADDKVEYVGLGPWENYADRASAAVFARHKASIGLVTGLADPDRGTIDYPADRLNPDNYIEPGEQGYRTGCRFMKIGGFEFTAVNAPFGFNVWPYPQSELEGKKHQWEIRKAEGDYTVNIDAVQMGVGGDNSWGARPHDEFMSGAGTYRLSFIVKGL